MRNTIFSNGEYYHVYNRGTEKRKVFNLIADYRRFVEGIQKFNSRLSVGHLINNGVSIAKPDSADAIVEMVAYCLMPNHFHFLLRQISDGGISKFIHKLSTGYTMYFNKRYERTGGLFQGTFKSKHIGDDAYLLHLSRYIHLNALELAAIDTIDKKRANDHLKNYCWTSYREYIDDGLPEYLTSGRGIILEQVGGNSGYKKFVLSYINRRHELSRFSLDKTKAG